MDQPTPPKAYPALQAINGRERETGCAQCAVTIHTRLAGYRSLCSVRCEAGWVAEHVLNGYTVYGDPRIGWVRAAHRHGLVLQARRCWRPDSYGRFVPEDHTVQKRTLTCEQRLHFVNILGRVDKCKNEATFYTRDGRGLCITCYVRLRTSGDAKYGEQWAIATRPYDDETAECTGYYRDKSGAEFALDFRELHLAILAEASPMMLSNVSPTVRAAVMADYEDWASCDERPSTDKRFST